jgi:hypothetical protein
MDYKQWVDLFGKAADDPLVRAAVTKAGITKPLKIGGHELSVIADVPGKGMSIIFADDSVLHPGTGLIGRPILSTVNMAVQHPTRKDLYTGPLPFKLTKTTGQAALRERLGTPVESEEDLRWDAWVVDGLQLTVGYTKDLRSIRSVSVKLPGSP